MDPVDQLYRKKQEALEIAIANLRRCLTVCRYVSELERAHGDEQYAKEVYDVFCIKLEDVERNIEGELAAIAPLIEMHEQEASFRHEEVTRPDIPSSRPPRKAD